MHRNTFRRRLRRALELLGSDLDRPDERLAVHLALKDVHDEDVPGLGNSIAAGIIIILGMAVCSRIAAIFALVGSTVGMLTGLALGANGVAIYNGLWGFNSFDAALAVGGVFFVLTWRSGMLAVACAVLAALLFGAIASVFTPWGLPALTLPFVFATLAFVLLKGTSTKLRAVEVADITTPEEHLARPAGQHSARVGRDAVRESPESEAPRSRYEDPPRGP